MTSIIKTYDAKVDAKKRITLRNSPFEYYKAHEYDNGIIVLEPKELVSSLDISDNTLMMIDKSIKNLNKGIVSKPINIKKLKK